MAGFLVQAAACAGPFEWAEKERLRADMALPSAFQGFQRQAEEYKKESGV